MAGHRMHEEDMLANLKKDVRSLLISAKTDLTPKQLKKDYSAMLGHDMPLKALGFISVLDMVKDMPDVVSISYLADGSLVLRAVSDECTRDLEQLVRQSANNQKKGVVSRFSPRLRHQQSRLLLPRRCRAPPPIPAYVRAQLRQLLYQGPLRLFELESSFIRRFGYPLPVSACGFFSVWEMLEAAADLVQVRQDSVGLVLTLKEQNKSLAEVHQLPIRTGPIKLQTTKTSPKSSSALPGKSCPVNPSPSNPSITQNPSCSHCLETAEDNTRLELVVEKQTEPDLHQEECLSQECVVKLAEELQERLLKNSVGGTISQELKVKLKEVVGQSSEGLSIHHLPVEYKRWFGEDLPVLQSGFSSVTELVGALDDIFDLKPAGPDQNQDWIVSNIQDAANTPLGVCKSTGQEVKQSSASYPNQDQEISVNTTTLQQMTEMYPTVEVRSFSLVCPDAVLGQKLKPPTRWGPREQVAAVVENVQSPSLFYVRFTESKEARIMEDMMFEMRICYSSPVVCKRYFLPECYVRPGQVCCMGPRGMWFYRVVIHQVLSSTQVEVYSVDFGDMIVVERANLQLLKSCYSALPAQAIPSALAGIKPTMGSWSTAATVSFKKLCCEQTLLATLCSYHGDRLQLYLYDTHADNNLCVHSALIAQGHGQACIPSISTTLCVQFNPVSCYLGKGLIYPEGDLEEEATPKTPE